MQEIGNRAVGPHGGDAQESMLIARNLARLYADILEEPLPPDLARLIGRLEQRVTSQTSRRDAQAG